MQQTILIILVPLACLGCAPSPVVFGTQTESLYSPVTESQGQLNVPTMIERLGGTYFVVECRANRVLWSDRIDAPLSEWRVLDSDLRGPHSIASDGTRFVVDDTDNHRLVTYVRDGLAFRRTGVVSGVGTRPHRVRFDGTTGFFYSLASNSQTLTKLVPVGESLEIVWSRNLPFLAGRYTRSFTFIDGLMYVVAGPGHITAVNYADDSLAVVATYPVPRELGAMNDLARIGGVWYVTGSGPGFPLYVVSSLADLARPQTDRKAELGLRGVPYYITEFDGRLWLPEIDEVRTGFVSFLPGSDGTLNAVQRYFETN